MSDTQDEAKVPHIVDAQVGAIVRRIRRLRGMSQTDLANAVGLTFQQIQKYERGLNRISCSKLFEIAAALEVSPAQLLPSSLEGRAGMPDMGREAIDLYVRAPRLFDVLVTMTDRQLRGFTAAAELMFGRSDEAMTPIAEVA